MKQYDAIIIGFGKGGKTLAGKLASTGKRVAMVEKSDQMFGGTCINVGCIPSKFLVLNAQSVFSKGDIPFEEKASLYQKAMEEKRTLTATLRQANYDKLNNFEEITIYVGEASFVSNNQVKVLSQGKEPFILEGENIYINTGSTPVIPPIEGIKGNDHVYFSEGLLNESKLPRHLVIVGGGYIGLEFSSIYSEFGSEVTILQDGNTFIPREDEDVADAIKASLEKKGIRIIMGAAIHQIEKNGQTSILHYKKDGKEAIVEADAILIATGRRPNTDGLNTKAAGVELTERGVVKVDEFLKTTAHNIWAMGDVVGGLQFTYLSLDDSRIIWSQMKGGSYNLQKRNSVPYSVFINPPYSRVGMNEREARKAGYDITVAKLAAAAIPKTKILGKTQGFLKTVIDKNSNKILGAMLFCEESFEMINLIKLAIDQGLEYSLLRDQIYTHPAMSEGLNDLFSI